MAASSSSSQDPGTNPRRTSYGPLLSVGKVTCHVLNHQDIGDLMSAYKDVTLNVVTFWEGEILDMKNYTFYTGKWPQDDRTYWASFPHAQPLRNALLADGGNCLGLSNHPHIYMRWKEQCYVSEHTDSEIRCIAGFYYVFLCYDHGTIVGKYHKPEPGVTCDYQKF